jgi:hypothetical protein
MGGKIMERALRMDSTMSVRANEKSRTKDTNLSLADNKRHHEEKGQCKT